MRRFDVGLAILFASGVVRAREPSLVLTSDNDSWQWRKDAGRAKPDLNSKAMIWTRHEQVGIGNTVGGYASAMLEALVEDRELVIHSVILQKFCEIVACSVREIPEPGYGPPKERFADGSVTKGDHFFYIVTQAPRGDVAARLQGFYVAAGCAGPGPELVEAMAQARDPRKAAKDADLWPSKCMYTKLLRGLIRGPGVRFRSELGWLQRHYVGSSDRFKRVMLMEQGDSEVPRFIFDYVIHIRTLDLIEDLSTDEGFVADASVKAEKFMRSTEFEAMVRCFALRIADSVAAPDAHHTGHKPHHASALVGALHSQGIPARKRLRRNLLSATDYDYGQAYGLKKHTAVASNHSGPHGSNAGPRRSDFSGAAAVSIYLATDALDIREEFASRLASAVKSALIHRGKAGVDIEVDYFAKSLPPAMFFLWTYPMNEMTTENWQGLVGTTAEWLFLSQGRQMLTVKGLKGGQRALPSSFAISAAAYGRVASVKFLEGSKVKPKNGRIAECTWSTTAFFS